jgi:hypothetical protein
MMKTKAKVLIILVMMAAVAPFAISIASGVQDECKARAHTKTPCGNGYLFFLGF